MAAPVPAVAPAIGRGAGADLRSIAFYLPQFHPIAENDEWWGTGFTEWTNVTAARPLFPGHQQPHLPADLGFYDLRVPEVRAAQAALARRYDVHGFCYYHYWFGGRRLLERPFREVLRSGAPDLPFCLCWANEPWTRRWDGGDAHVLMPQNYSERDDRDHLRWLAEAFGDDRYIRIDGRPLFLVYRVGHLPDARRTADTWRAEAQRLGIGELFLCAVTSFSAEAPAASRIGFDGTVVFQPDFSQVMRKPPWWWRLRRVSHAGRLRHFVHPYDQVARRAMAEAGAHPRPEPSFPCVVPGWDNTARRQRDGLVLQGSTPERFQRWVRSAVAQSPLRGDRDLLFVNAWNEWAEGNHLEPDRRWGHGYLSAHAAGRREGLADRGLGRPTTATAAVGADP